MMPEPQFKAGDLVELTDVSGCDLDSCLHPTERRAVRVGDTMVVSKVHAGFVYWTGNNGNDVGGMYPYRFRKVSDRAEDKSTCSCISTLFGHEETCPISHKNR